jgi:hypothetical protein
MVKNQLRKKSARVVMPLRHVLLLRLPDAGSRSERRTISLGNSARRPIIANPHAMG